ncbi:MAG: aminotransferase [Candidatus Peregrinibacteria bacterium GW2011_GWC2_39_14]|nr:MAG: DegT/DnrJ/EryC1/StrS aminotransferase [Candidatus Peregrinibacteria bacterium GW2011_GWA2_38_36]KKR05937.1 MAG: aminotransferase [Candidatus Peregrinibacteria bacterium GW2011_GWC2_39_14]
MTNIPFKKPIYITKPLLPDLKNVNEKLKEIWDSGWLTNFGAQHALLEKKLKKYLNVQHISLFNNGTNALMIAIKALNLTGEVITTPFTFPATPNSLTWNNITPVFCDIDDKTMNIDADKIEKLITPKTSAILAVHVFGTPCNIEKIQKIANKHKLKVIYDAAHAFGTKINGKGIGSFGDITMFSFHATKLFHTIEGGALTFNDKNLKEKINLLRNFGIKNEETVLAPGINGKMNEIQAGIGLLVLNMMKKAKKTRKSLYETYEKHLKNINGIKLLQNKVNVKKSYQYFAVRINEEEFGTSRDKVYKQFKKYNVFTRKYFHPLCSEYQCYKHLQSAKITNLPVAQKIGKEVLCMPMHEGLSKKDIENICNILKSFKK